MNENEKPALGSTEAAVLTVVELIARAAQMSEQHMSYWLDLYYQVRFKHEAAEIYGELTERTAGPDPVMARLDELEKKIDELDGVARNLQCVVSDRLSLPEHKNPGRNAEGPRYWLAKAAADAVRRAENQIALNEMLAEPRHSIVPPTPPDKYPPAPPRPAGKKEPETEDNTSSDAARHLPLEGKAEEEPTPVMRGRETIKLQERAKSETRSEAVKKQKAAEREFKIRVAERLREARTHGVKIGDIVTASCGAVPDGAVLTILDGGFRPIADYRALDAALDQLAKDNTSSVTAEP